MSTMRFLRCILKYCRKGIKRARHPALWGQHRGSLLKESRSKANFAFKKIGLPKNRRFFGNEEQKARKSGDLLNKQGERRGRIATMRRQCRQSLYQNYTLSKLQSSGFGATPQSVSPKGKNDGARGGGGCDPTSKKLGHNCARRHINSQRHILRI